jgi:hypothetical protein
MIGPALDVFERVNREIPHPRGPPWRGCPVAKAKTERT